MSFKGTTQHKTVMVFDIPNWIYHNLNYFCKHYLQVSILPIALDGSIVM